MMVKIMCSSVGEPPLLCLFIKIFHCDTEGGNGSIMMMMKMMMMRSLQK